MNARTVTAGVGLEDVDAVTRRYLAAKPGTSRSLSRRWSMELWQQVAAIDAALSGRPWQLELAADAQLPSWLIELCSGHIGSAVEVPAPTLFRTAGIGTAWTVSPVDVIELRGIRQRRGDARSRVARLLHAIERAGGTTDADVYVTGDGSPAGQFRAEVHAVFGVFDCERPLAELASFSDGFRMSPPVWQGGRCVTYTWTPISGRVQ
ncbi:hypothetical protein [Plantibacter sp. CFBP 8804]|uniref:hypothetical protein n=1 Tax=Plantibacter sp. CFBP 8804 TaxID=2775270 RepID=UPI0017863BF2|nr:hypothetical protein [Plantibacter sp. CFBP 8804]MBD8519146.1 hypothetical protein [Plantibacter sp. CFBP 8804]